MSMTISSTTTRGHLHHMRKVDFGVQNAPVANGLPEPAPSGSDAAPVSSDTSAAQVTTPAKIDPFCRLAAAAKAKGAPASVQSIIESRDLKAACKAFSALLRSAKTAEAPVEGTASVAESGTEQVAASANAISSRWAYISADRSVPTDPAE